MQNLRATMDAAVELGAAKHVPRGCITRDDKSQVFTDSRPPLRPDPPTRGPANL